MFIWKITIISDCCISQTADFHRNADLCITINVPVVYMGRYEVVFLGPNGTRCARAI